MDNKKDHDYLNSLWNNKKQLWIKTDCLEKNKSDYIFQALIIVFFNENNF